ncbi:hypothetical protein QVH35_04770 [Candidatus Nitrosotenuis chungbukensis]|uniref:hypothetical protein n=1 Tax=Candidatus Nitrosotenuis chungbukensis TaxID=1353246 RepID=UPI0005B2C380|nr:hypothetical protein [Candidatus Nitrosotenuis chungbukensis]WKT58679.1 hypothetical protein QVH35_04770 [Candidatus Nitrosotenuis chungbukensis]
MAIQKEIQEYMNRHLDLLLAQTKSYVPFIKTAFPGMNLADACFNLVVGNAFPVFLGQYAMRIKSPTEEDLIEFGKMASQYREKISELFSE